MTNVAGGLGSALGISASESAYGTFTTPTRFIEFNSESLKLVKHVVQGVGLRYGGVFGRSARRAVTTYEVTGDIDTDVPTRGAGLIFAHSLGSYPTAVSGAYTFTPGDQGLVSFTTQVSMSRYDGVVVEKNVVGCKVDQLVLSISNGGFLNAKLTIDGAAMDNTNTLATPSYPTPYDAFQFAEGTLKFNSSTVAYIRDWNMTLNNGLNKSRFNLGNAGKKASQVHNAFRTLTGQFTAEYVDNIVFNDVLTDTAVSMELTFTNGVEILDITIPVSYFDDGTPMVAGPSDIDIPVTFTSLDGGVNPVITVVYTTPDTTL